MTPEQIVVIQASFDMLLTDADALAAAFYARLFQLNPSIRGLFPADMAEQQHKFMTLLNLAVNGLWDPDSIAPVLRQMGQRHVSYGVRPAHYANIEDALLTTLQQFLGQQYTPEVAAA
jgi:hemoglobin-like flavoprotein